MKPLIDAFTSLISRIKGLNYIDEEALKGVIREIQRILLKADVSVDLVSSITRAVEARFKEERPPQGIGSRDYLIYILYEELIKVLGGEAKPSLDIPRRPYRIMLVGVEGSGKTTTAAKLAAFYMRRGLKVGLIETDTQRPGAYHQLKQLSEKIGAQFYGEENAEDPVAILRRGLEELRNIDLVIVDTAGRHRNEEELLEEARRIYEEARPDEVMLVIDATVGKQAAAQAEAFARYVPVGSIFLTKMDSTAKAGGALTSVIRIGARIKFIGLGEGIDELEPFEPRRFVARLLGMGDLETLVERIRALTEEERIMEEIEEGKLNLLTLKKQLEMTMRLGPLSKILQLLPSNILPLRAIDEERMEDAQRLMKKWYAALNSMTREELLNPDLINSSRIRRIARGAGVTPRDVKTLLNQYQLMRRMINELRRSRRRLRLGI